MNTKRFYVYALFDSGVPFYVGKGKDKRAHGHVGEARRGSPLPVHKKIRSMVTTPRVKILCDNLTEVDAYELEELTIRTVGRRYNKTGPLLNLSAGGKGGTAGFVVELTDKQIAKKNAALKSPEVRAKISAALIGRQVSEHTRKLISKNHKGKILSKETKDKISKTKLGTCNYIPNEKQRAAISEMLRGRAVSDITKKRISNGVLKHGGLTLDQAKKQRKKVLVKVTCPHCCKTGARSIMMRWHFNNCKLL